MSSSITIKARNASIDAYDNSPKAGSSSSLSSYTSSSPSSLASSSPKPDRTLHNRRPSLLSSALSQQKSTVVDVGEPNGPLRLISYLSSSQGFTWNPEIFLPPYLDCEYTPLEHKREPVHEIFLSDEESKNMLPE